MPSFTFAASAEVPPCLGAMPVFAEIDPQTFNLDPARLGDALKAARDARLNCVGKTTAGFSASLRRMDQIAAFAEAEGLWLLDDAAQSYGATWQGRKVSTLAPITATSFFPAKPLAVTVMAGRFSPTMRTWRRSCVSACSRHGPRDATAMTESARQRGLIQSRRSAVEKLTTLMKS